LEIGVGIRDINIVHVRSTVSAKLPTCKFRGVILNTCRVF
jgi:hypothetical protein